MKKLGALKITASIILVSTAVFCVCRRMPECFASDKPAALAVAALTLSDGTYKLADTETTTLADTNTCLLYTSPSPRD